MCECYFFDHYDYRRQISIQIKSNCFMCKANIYGKDRIYRISNSMSILELKTLDHIEYMSSLEIRAFDDHIEYMYDSSIVHKINTYQFYKYNKISMDEYKLYRKFIYGDQYCNSLSFSTSLNFIAFIKLRRFLERVQSKFFDKNIKFGHLKVQQKGLDSITCKFRYIESDLFLSTVFSKTRYFSSNDFTPEGHFIFRSTKYDILQSAVVAYSKYTMLTNSNDRKKIIYKFLNDNSTNYDLFCENYHSIIKVLDLFKMHEIKINSYLSEYFDDYTANTIFLEKENNTNKLLLFCKKCPTVAEFIWNGSFSSEKERERIYYRLNLPTKLKNAFVKSKTVSELFKKLNMRRQLKIPVEDRWVNELQSMGEKGILLYEQLCDLLDYIEIAKYPHYISGFIDSDRINSAEARYWQKYSEAQSFYAKGGKK